MVIGGSVSFSALFLDNHHVLTLMMVRPAFTRSSLRELVTEVSMGTYLVQVF